MFKNPFSFSGRIRRTEYGVSFIIYIVVILFFSEIVPEESPVTFIYSIPALWFIWAQGAKRCHDVGNSGWWQLIPFYALWLLFQDGQYGLNQYGENPKGIHQVIYQSSTKGATTSSGGYQGGYNGGHNGGHNNHGNMSGQHGPSSPNYSSNSKGSSGYKPGDLYK